MKQHGESELNVQQRIGGDPPLSPNGKLVLFIFKLIVFNRRVFLFLQYADALAEYMANGE